MHHYRISAGNPEGTDWVLDIDHEKEFTTEEFNEIAEAAILHALEFEYEKEGHAFTSSIETDFVFGYLLLKGFVTSDDLTQAYHFEPYWGRESIKSVKLLQWFDRKSGKDAPQYIKEGAGEQRPTDKTQNGQA